MYITIRTRGIFRDAGAITRERADLLREADDIVLQEMRKAGLYEKIWQFPVVLLPVGKKAERGGRAGRAIYCIAADCFDGRDDRECIRVAPEVIQTITKKIMQLPGIDAVFYDLTNKPPATIEWGSG